MYSEFRQMKQNELEVKAELMEIEKRIKILRKALASNSRCPTLSVMGSIPEK